MQEGSKDNYTSSSGIRIESISESLLIITLIFGPSEVRFPDNVSNFTDFETKFPNEIVNGLNASVGINTFIKVNGITLYAIMQSLKQSNSIAIGGMGNRSFSSNGIQIADAESSTVFSIGIIASTLNTKVYTGNS